MTAPAARARRHFLRGGFFFAFAGLGLATGTSEPSLIAALSAAAISAACFTFAHRLEKR